MSFENSNIEPGELLVQIAASNENAFRQLFNTHVKKLTYFAFSLVKSKESSQEIVDEVFIRLWKNRENAADIKNIKVYLYTAVKNASLNYISRKAFEQITEPFESIDILINDDQAPDKQMITMELFNKIHEAVNSLPPRCKMIFKLVREDGLKYKEVAHILNISPSTVDAQMVIAAKQIKQKIAPYISVVTKTSFKKN